ncbi:arginase family protein [Nocardia thraciensis]
MIREATAMINVIGAPFNSAGRTDGVARAPAVLRDAGLVQRLRDRTAVRDAGDVEVGKPSTARNPSSGLLAQDSLIAMTTAVRDAVRQTLREGRFPLVLGGDCPVLLGALKGAQDEYGATGLLFADGHEDAWPPRHSTTGEAADCELGLALGYHRDGLPDALSAQLPRLAADQVIALGPRDSAELTAYRITSLASSITLYTDEQLRGRATTPTEASVHRLRGAGLPWWLHVDLDALSTEAMPAVDYPQPGGLDWTDLRAITAAGLGAGCLGMSVVIYDPDLDHDRRHAHAIVDYLADAFAAP